MAITLANLRSDVREYTGSPSASQISDSEITTTINQYYREIMPLQLDLPETKGTSTVTTADTDTTADLPDDTIMIKPPVRIGSGASPSSYSIGGFYYEPAYFYSKHNGGETKGTPVDVLLTGRSIEFAPAADGVYTILFPSIEKPTALSADADEITQDRLRDLIAVSTAVMVLNKRTDTESIEALKAVYALYTETLNIFGIKPDKERMADARNNKSNMTTGV